MPALGQGSDLVGQKFGLLTVIERSEKKKDYMSIWVCRCSCGNVKEVRINHLRGGQIKSCGCRSSRNRFGSDHASWRGVGEIGGSFLAKWRKAAQYRNLTIAVTPKDLWEMYLSQNRKCALTGLPVEFSKRSVRNGTASIDRIDSKLGYLPGNIQIVHRDVNRMKLEYPQDYFIKICKLIADKNQ